MCSAGEVWAGRPAKLLRKMEEGEAEFILRSADNYAILAALHAEENAKTFPELEADKARRRRAVWQDACTAMLLHLFPLARWLSILGHKQICDAFCVLRSCLAGTAACRRVSWSIPSLSPQRCAGAVS